MPQNLQKDRLVHTPIILIVLEKKHIVLDPLKYVVYGLVIYFLPIHFIDTVLH